jgi:hypothetical protein
LIDLVFVWLRPEPEAHRLRTQVGIVVGRSFVAPPLVKAKYIKCAAASKVTK